MEEGINQIDDDDEFKFICTSSQYYYPMISDESFDSEVSVSNNRVPETYRPTLDTSRANSYDENQNISVVPSSVEESGKSAQHLCTTDNYCHFIPDQAFPGVRKFKIEISHKLYSKEDNKVYLNLGEIIPIKCRWSELENSQDLKIRAMVLFCSDQKKSQPVRRCANHSEEDKTVHSDYFFKTTDPASIYQKYNGHYSIVTKPQAPQISDDFIPISYSFHCYNSDLGGKQSKAIKLVLLLQDKGNDIGSQTLDLKVCANPERDRRPRIEGGKKRKALSSNGQSGKKLNNQQSQGFPFDALSAKYIGTSGSKEITEKKIFDIIGIPVPNEAIKRKIIEYARDVIISYFASRGENFALLKPYLDELCKK